MRGPAGRDDAPVGSHARGVETGLAGRAATSSVSRGSPFAAFLAQLSQRALERSIAVRWTVHEGFEREPVEHVGGLPQLGHLPPAVGTPAQVGIDPRRLLGIERTEGVSTELVGLVRPHCVCRSHTSSGCMALRSARKA